MIESILNKVNSTIQPMNEYAEYKPNALIASVIAHRLSGLKLIYNAYISEPNSDQIGIPIKLHVDINNDDIEALSTDNVIYCFIEAGKIDYTVHDMPYYDMSDYLNKESIYKYNRLIPVNRKAWRDNSSLYLLKINLNSGVVSRFDHRESKFKHQTVNWLTSTPEDIVELLLTEDYIQDYFSSQLNSLLSYENFVTQDLLHKKDSLESEGISI